MGLGAAFLHANYERLLAFREKGPSMPARAALNLIRGAMEHDMHPKLARITAPTLVLIGEEDVLTPVGVARDPVSGMPHARLVILAVTGHAAPLEQVETFCAVVRGLFGAAVPDVR